MARWAREREFDAEIDAAIERAGGIVSPDLVRAMIGVESAFNPRAYRAEPHIGDASRGLMQILLRTAKGAGFTGTGEQLYDPATNIRFGVAHLAGLVERHQGDFLAAVSAYNNGNGKRVTKTVTVCDVRNADGSCKVSHVAEPGQFFNQPYVDKVLSALQYFGGELAPGGGSTAGALVTWVVIGGAIWLAVRSKR